MDDTMTTGQRSLAQFDLQLDTLRGRRDRNVAKTETASSAAMVTYHLRELKKLTHEIRRVRLERRRYAESLYNSHRRSCARCREAMSNERMCAVGRSYLEAI